MSKRDQAILDATKQAIKDFDHIVGNQSMSMHTRMYLMVNQLDIVGLIPKVARDKRYAVETCLAHAAISGLKD